MRNSANGNIYEATLDEAWTLFEDHLDGCRSGLICVAASETLDARTRNALESAAAARGYGRGTCTFANLAADGALLDEKALFLLMEALDPLCVIAADEAAARALADAYRCAVPLDAPCRLFGRDAVAFRSFARMLDDDRSKQRAWAILKKLPPRDGR